jgi:hypothetical protein
MVRDPVWGFVYWELSCAERKAIENVGGFRGYFLRIYDCGEDGVAKAADSFYDVPVSTEDQSWYLSFPPEHRRFRISFWAQYKTGEQKICTSSLFVLPPILDKSIYAGYSAAQKKLSLLSGIDELPIIHNALRPSRVPIVV